ncbi:murein L,D-transpeptidase [Photobacterium gaetbulicola]|uniref:Putative amidase n=1 Tax=Photobacterium gaetbulicola Gung47 TaxID=658445 RepID=A0A0C5WN15_9GAMM|nr:L,D-transpeptidase family protein [Photobacterium gaetbulicola]AJR08533.1 putative amidase [Photobacterium gaetbulicola Gung47]PSU03290.1 murein L,D-transpeptidase [Photobacterium gaetbulicola]
MTCSDRMPNRFNVLYFALSFAIFGQVSAEKVETAEYALLVNPIPLAEDNFSQGSALPASPANESSVLDLSLLSIINLSSHQQLCGFVQSSLCFSDEVKRIYAANGYMPLWWNNELRELLETRLRVLAFSGLVSGIDRRLAELAELEQVADQRAYDILATDTYLLYEALMHQLYSEPSLMFRHQTLILYPDSENGVLPGSVAASVINVPFLTSRLIGYGDNFAMTKGVLAQVERFYQLPAHSYQPHGRQLIKLNESVPNGLAMLAVLNAYGDLSDESFEQLSAEPTLINNGELNQAIRRFQQRNGLEDDGVIGPATAQQLALPYSEVARLLALNLYRSQLGATGNERPIIRVNIPDYRLQITHQQEVVFESRVIVGRTARPTNLFSSSMNIMVVNPYWNVPETIKTKDVIPGMKASSDYLQQTNLKMIRSWDDRTEISPEMVEWSNVDPNTFPYEFMQSPGRGNALGNVKFLMPNDFSVYLHDTPSRSLFNKARRNLSSGCVRVEKAAELAEYVLDYQQRPSWRNYQQLVSDGRTNTITLPRKIDVDVTYVTAWVDENNQLQLREDIYGYDRPIKRPVKLQYSTVKNYRQ